ncbi:MAG: DUF935 family protein, partial [Bacteroidota bacterium]
MATQESAIIPQINITQTRRSTLDIQNWRNALRQSESIINPNRSALYDIYSECLLDAHLKAITEKRKLAVANTPLLFVDEGHEISAVQDLVNTDAFVHLLGYIMEARLWGFSLIELNYNEGKINPILISRKNVSPERGEILRNQYDTGGFSFREKPYIDYVLEVGETNNLGLLLNCCPYVIYKKNCIADMANYSSLFSQPYRIFKYAAHNDQTRQELEKAARDMGSAAYVIIPDTAQIEFLQNNAQSSGTFFSDEIQIMNKELSKLILGNTSSVENAGSTSYAQSLVHERMELSIHDSDKIYCKNILNDKLIPMLRNYGVETGNGKFVFKENEHVDLPTRLQMDLKISEKIQISDEYWYNSYNIPRPVKEIKNI